METQVGTNSDLDPSFQIHHIQPLNSQGIFADDIAALYAGSANPFNPDGSWNRIPLLVDEGLAEAAHTASLHFADGIGGIFGQNLHRVGDSHPGLQEFWRLELNEVFDPDLSYTREQKIARLEDLQQFSQAIALSGEPPLDTSKADASNFGELFYDEDRGFLTNLTDLEAVEGRVEGVDQRVADIESGKEKIAISNEQFRADTVEELYQKMLDGGMLTEGQTEVYRGRLELLRTPEIGLDATDISKWGIQATIDYGKFYDFLDDFSKPRTAYDPATVTPTPKPWREGVKEEYRAELEFWKLVANGDGPNTIEQAHSDGTGKLKFDVPGSFATFIDEYKGSAKGLILIASVATLGIGAHAQASGSSFDEAAEDLGVALPPEAWAAIGMSLARDAAIATIPVAGPVFLVLEAIVEAPAAYQDIRDLILFLEEKAPDGTNLKAIYQQINQSIDAAEDWVRTVGSAADWLELQLAPIWGSSDAIGIDGPLPQNTTTPAYQVEQAHTVDDVVMPLLNDDALDNLWGTTTEPKRENGDDVQDEAITNLPSSPEYSIIVHYPDLNGAISEPTSNSHIDIRIQVVRSGSSFPEETVWLSTLPGDANGLYNPASAADGDYVAKIDETEDRIAFAEGDPSSALVTLRILANDDTTPLEALRLMLRSDQLNTTVGALSIQEVFIRDHASIELGEGTTADLGNAQEETDTNAPDLSITNAWINETSEQIGGDLSVFWDNENIGGGISARSTVGVFISEFATFDDRAILVDTNSTVELAFGEGEYHQSASFRISSNVGIGDQFIFVVADIDDDVEGDPSGNNVFGPIALTIDPAPTPISVRIVAYDGVTQDGGAGGTLADIRIERTGDGKSVKVNWAVEPTGRHPVSPDDFKDGVLPSGQVSLTSSDPSEGIDIENIYDGFPEFDETYRVRIWLAEENSTPAAIAQKYAYGAIEDNDGFIAEGDDFGDTLETAYRTTGSVNIHGVNEQPGDVDVFSAYLLEAVVYTITYSNSGGSDVGIGFANIDIFDDLGNQYDVPDRNPLQIDASKKFTPSASGEFFFRLSDQSDNGTGKYQYGLNVSSNDIDGSIQRDMPVQASLSAEESIRAFTFHGIPQGGDVTVAIRSENFVDGLGGYDLTVADTSGRIIDANWVETGRGAYAATVYLDDYDQYLFVVEGTDASAHGAFEAQRIGGMGSLTALSDPADASTDDVTTSSADDEPMPEASAYDPVDGENSVTIWSLPTGQPHMVEFRPMDGDVLVRNFSLTVDRILLPTDNKITFKAGETEAGNAFVSIADADGVRSTLELEGITYQQLAATDHIDFVHLAELTPEEDEAPNLVKSQPSNLVSQLHDDQADVFKFAPWMGDAVVEGFKVNVDRIGLLAGTEATFEAGTAASGNAFVSIAGADGVRATLELAGVSYAQLAQSDHIDFVQIDRSQVLQSRLIDGQADTFVFLPSEGDLLIEGFEVGLDKFFLPHDEISTFRAGQTEGGAFYYSIGDSTVVLIDRTYDQVASYDSFDFG